MADAGIGIHHSFIQGGGGHRPATAGEAIGLAIRRQTTSTADRRGNGLYGLAEVVRQNGGTLEIVSGRGVLSIDSASVEPNIDALRESIVLDGEHHCTVVDFRLDVSHPISLQAIFPSEFDLRIEDMENDDGGYTLRVQDYASEVATREGGDRLRTRAVNLLKEGASPLVVDFSGTSIASASFIDEFIGKLGQVLGADEFRRTVRLSGISEENAMLVRSMLAHRTSN